MNLAVKRSLATRLNKKEKQMKIVLSMYDPDSNVSMSDVARKLNISVSTVSRYVRADKKEKASIQPSLIDLS